MKKYKVAIVGATGLVGKTFLDILKEYDFPVEKLKLLASKKSAGRVIDFNNQALVVEELKEDSFADIDLALFSAGSDVSLKYAPFAIESGALVIDNSSAFRNDELVPLIVPEVNFLDYSLNRLIANPNCSTIQVVLPLKALDDKFNVTKVYFTTYQAVSGSGNEGKEDYMNCLKGLKNTFYPYDITKTCIPKIDVAADNFYSKEEMKMVYETRKILHKPQLQISATCVRVPILNSHAVSVICELEKEFTLKEITQTLAAFENIIVLDDLAKDIYPTSIVSNDTDKVYVGRIRRDLTNNQGLLFYCTADNIRKGAASNAVQIALLLAKLDII